MPPDGGTRSSISTMSGGCSSASSNAAFGVGHRADVDAFAAQKPDQRAHDRAARRDDETFDLSRRRQLFMGGPLVGEHSIAEPDKP